MQRLALSGGIAIQSKLVHYISYSIVTTCGLASCAARGMSSRTIKEARPTEPTRSALWWASAPQANAHSLDVLVAVIDRAAVLRTQTPEPAVVRFGMAQVVQSRQIEM